VPNILNSAGLQLATQPELLTYFTNAYQKIYGSDINISSDTPDGQNINILIQSILDLEDLLSQIYNSFDPDNAVGVQLDQRVTINGIQRQSGTYSITNITLVLNGTVTLFGLDQNTNPVYTVSDNLGNNWILLQTQTNLSTGTHVLSFRAAQPGKNITIPNTIQTPVTIVLNVISINNPTAQEVIGLDEETDASLRIRRSKSVSISSQGYLAGLIASLQNINGLSSVYVYENKTGSVDADGVPSHSIWVIVDGVPTIVQQSNWSPVVNYSYADVVTSGGINYISWVNNNINNPVTDTNFWGIYNPIAQSIYTKRNAGCGLYGDQTYTLTQIDGSEFIVQWDVVSAINLFIYFNATSINGVNPPNLELIISYLVSNFIPDVYQEVNINELSTFVQQADSNCLVTNAGFSTGIVQELTLNFSPTFGEFKLNYNGQATADINWNDATSVIQSKLRAISTLANCTVTGSLASKILTINLVVFSSLGLITVSDNNLASGFLPVLFSFNEFNNNILFPTQKKNKFIVSADKIIILPMLLNPSTVKVPRNGVQVFKGLGGYGVLEYSILGNTSGGFIEPDTGKYTAGNIIGQDLIQVIDKFGNTAQATVNVI
jgi:hypothetical protein